MTAVLPPTLSPDPPEVLMPTPLSPKAPLNVGSASTNPDANRSTDVDLTGPRRVLDSLGLSTDLHVLCLLATSDAHRIDDLMVSLKRLHEGALIAGAHVWVRCFDVELQGTLCSLDALMEQIESYGPGLEHLAFPGRGDHDLGFSVRKAMLHHGRLPNGRDVDRVLVIYNGDGRVGDPLVYRRRTLPTVFLVMQQAFAGTQDLAWRVQQAQQAMPQATVLPETRLVMALEQRALQEVVATSVGDVSSLPVPSRTRSRL